MSSSSDTGTKGGFFQGIPQVSTLSVHSLATSGCGGSTPADALELVQPSALSRAASLLFATIWQLAWGI